MMIYQTLTATKCNHSIQLEMCKGKTYKHIFLERVYTVDELYIMLDTILTYKMFFQSRIQTCISKNNTIQIVILIFTVIKVTHYAKHILYFFSFKKFL